MVGVEKLHLQYLVDDPWAVEVSVLGGLPPADAGGGGPGPQRDLKGHQASLVAAVAEEKLLQETPAETTVHRELQKDGLGTGVWGCLATAQAQEELNKPAGHNCIRPRARTYELLEVR